MPENELVGASARDDDRVAPIHVAHEAWLELYDQMTPTLRARGEAIRALLAQRLAEDAGLKLHSITLRVKTRDSVAAKLARPDRTYGALWELTDLVGLRVITYFEDGVDRVGRVLEAHLPIDFRHSVDKRKPAAEDRFGYRSLHYVCRMSPEDRVHGEIRYEIQIRTLLEHAWAEIEHDLGYKSRDSVPAVARRRLNRLAGLLELADQEFAAIRRDLAEYATTLPARIASSDEIALDRLSLASLLDCVEVKELDAAIAGQLGRRLGGSPFFPEYLLRMLEASGLSTVGMTRSALVRHRAAIVAMVQPYFRFASAAWRLSPEDLEHVAPGYSLLFLVHAVVLDAPSLGLDKFERLVHLYHRVDYPEDRPAAQRVAGELLAVLDRQRVEA
ncbi:MAG: GTP pyrophosphokinase family protein [Myxococcales bacterium]|nr:GTP pyrophosphokinase family protein [Myxococcales bacterium]